VKKIISLFQRNYDGDRKVRDEVVPGAEWVQAGEGVATRKFDGTCCAIINGILFKRYDAKQGKQPPFGFIPAQDYDPVTGHMPGWLEVGNGNEDRWFREGCENTLGQPFGGGPDGTYELCGPKVQGNPEGFDKHVLVRHGCEVLGDAPRTYDALREYLMARTIEGIVWHHPDGRMVKIKRKDFHPIPEIPQ
jgi:hypothetical protein